MRFNYLSDAAPDVVDRLRSIRVAPYLLMPAYAAVTAVVVVFSIAVLLHYRVIVAQEEERTAQQRYDESRVALADAKLERTHIETLLVLDKRLRSVRESGEVVSERLADIANHVPRRAWLSGIAKAPDGIIVDGETEGLEGLGDTLNAMMAGRTVVHPRLVRAALEGRSRGAGILGFEVALEDRSQ